MKHIFTYSLYLLIGFAFFVSCATTQWLWTGTPIQQLPFVMEDIDEDSTDGWVYFSQELFYKHFNVSPAANKLDRLFNGGTSWNQMPYGFDYIKPRSTPGHFYKRLPDVNHNKVLLFVCYDRANLDDDYESGILSWFELQTFNSNGTFIDKRIVFARLGYDCQILRTFTYSEDAVISIKDREYCVDLSADDPYAIAFDTTINRMYKITDDGKILECE